MSQQSRQAPAVDGRMRAYRDLRLIEAYRAGRADAFDELVGGYASTIGRVLTQLHVVPADVEDLTQEVFLRVYRNLHHFRGQSSFYTWLYRITLNVFFDHRKKGRRADARLTRLQSALADLGEQGSRRSDPFHVTYDALTSERFAAAVQRLPALFRDVVALREFDDLSYEEIALATGISIGTVRSRLSRARARLKSLLAPHLGEVHAA